MLLANVANQMAGATGDVVLGVFSPTIHALRLHYVEFFSKFLEFGGRKFEPLHK